MSETGGGHDGPDGVLYRPLRPVCHARVLRRSGGRRQAGPEVGAPGVAGAAAREVAVLHADALARRPRRVVPLRPLLRRVSLLRPHPAPTTRRGGGPRASRRWPSYPISVRTSSTRSGSSCRSSTSSTASGAGCCSRCRSSRWTQSTLGGHHRSVSDLPRIGPSSSAPPPGPRPRPDSTSS